MILGSKTKGKPIHVISLYVLKVSFIHYAYYCAKFGFSPTNLLNNKFKLN